MKKQDKNVKKSKTNGKTVQNTVKKEVKSPKNRKKSKNSDIKRAFLLAGMLTVLSASISLAVIIFHSLMKENAPSAAVDVPDIPAESAQPQTGSSEIDESAARESPVLTQETPVPAHTPANEPSATAADRPAVSLRTSAAVKKPPERPPEKPSEITGLIAFVIDDAGNNLPDLEPFLRVPLPLTIAVLPGLPHSAEAARRIRAAGKEVFLHQPMEALGAQYPGPAAIYTSMNAAEIRKVLKQNIDEIGPVTGINNHQGSKVTEDREAVETILAFCAENNLLFLDSRTTAGTVVPDEARRMGVTIAERHVFIDNDRSKSAMINSITGGLSRAKREGQVIMIGHAFSRELAPLLAEQYPLLVNQGFVIKTASDIIK